MKKRFIWKLMVLIPLAGFAGCSQGDSKPSAEDTKKFLGGQPTAEQAKKIQEAQAAAMRNISVTSEQEKIKRANPNARVNGQ